MGIGTTYGGVFHYPYTVINNDQNIARFFQNENPGSIVRDTSTIIFISSAILVLKWMHTHSLNSEHVYDTLIR